MARVITVALVDDDRMLTDGMRAWLGGVPGLRLVATATTPAELLRPPDPELPYAAPDVVLLDLRLGDGSDPVENIRLLLSSGSRVLVISTVPDRVRIIESVRAGADGYLTKDNDLPTLVAAIEDVAAGRGAHSPELAFACAHDDSPARPRLSPRERQILLDYASGMTLKSAARRAGITVHTAKDYLDRVKAKYRQAGRPAYTKIDLARLVREDSLDGQ
ncbi:response regulator [Streptomyces rubiginosohelvolus]|uniref:response regulator transcription factor n=1 Tax=Streptomyces TaxID=1883 RepID=UPI001909FF0E|nr:MULTISPECIES: response regulator transcription factor [unclassified Streptomyces]MBK3530421.1 response regulator transcription factor [Streptomyces sp. MBT72]MBK3539052.1 response regulator transcription factor [Streptomyces sp. MBT67]MBK3550174.1 response regulator transcription factor [Streptomyces sp. MBT61]MBK6029517.1 response regulator transcription factor [Streptomyces sp. MBT59]